GVAEERAAGLAGRVVVVEMPGTACPANACVASRQFAIGASVADADREHRPVDPEGAALVIYEAARPELRKRQKARALKIGLPSAFCLAGDESHQREARKVISGQEALGRQKPISIKVARRRFGTLFEQPNLLDRLVVA